MYVGILILEDGEVEIGQDDSKAGKPQRNIVKTSFIKQSKVKKRKVTNKRGAMSYQPFLNKLLKKNTNPEEIIRDIAAKLHAGYWGYDEKDYIGHRVGQYIGPNCSGLSISTYKPEINKANNSISKPAYSILEYIIDGEVKFSLETKFENN